MKTFLMLCLVALTTSTMLAQVGTTNHLNEKRGFKCFSLGEPISKHNEKMKLLAETSVGTKEYTVTDTTLLSISDNIKIKAINLTAYNDTICSIGIMVEKKYNPNLLDVLRAAYGMGTKPNKYEDKYRWLSEGAKVLLTYDANFKYKYGVAIFTDMDIKAERDRAKLQKAKRSIDDI